MKFATTTLVLFASFAQDAAAFQPLSSSRRDMLQQVTAAAIVGLATGAIQQPAQAVVEPCPPRTSNCIRTYWIAPEGTTKEDMVKTIKSVLSEYPQSGQADVDKGGWTLVEDNLEGSGSARVEFKSGIGNFAKFFNGGKPFIDDLVLDIDGTTVQVRSASRIGDSDLGVNQKRLTFLASSLRAAGWRAPDPKY